MNNESYANIETKKDRLTKYITLSLTMISVIVIIIIALFIIYRGSLPFIKKYEINDTLYTVNLYKFLTGNTWFISPNIYGVGFVILNTIYTTLLALLISVPTSIFTALFVTRIAPKTLVSILNTIIELLSSVPSIIFGLFGLAVITNMVKNISSFIGFQSAGGQSTITTSIVLAIMIMPTITIMSIEAMKSVNKNIVLGSLALGATPTQTNFKVVLSSAKSGIFAGVILGVSRALGEATAVSLVCGNSGSGFSLNPFDTTRTLTSTMLLGIHETIGLDYDIRFSVGIVLIFIIFITNIILNRVKNRIGNIHAK